jgi:magnesium transporter
MKSQETPRSGNGAALTTSPAYDAWVDELYDRVHKLLDRGETRKAQVILQALLAVDQAEIFSDLSDQEQRQVLQGLPPVEVADILEKLEDEEAAEVAEWIPPEALADILDEMEPDEAADLLGDLTPEQTDAVLKLMEDREEVSPLLIHADETAGGLMTSEYMAFERQISARSALEALRAWGPEHEYLYYFVVDSSASVRRPSANDIEGGESPYGKLLGVVSLLQLIKADPDAPVESFMDRSVVSAPVGADQETCARLMSRYDLTALPVVDDANRLTGVITIDDVVDVIEDEATEDIQRLGGSEPLDKPYLLTSAWEITRRRIGWLLLLFVTGMITTSVLQYFESTLQKVVALTFFIPLLTGTGGNAGSQTTATIIRALSVGEVEKKDALNVLWHEINVGLLTGLLVAIAGFLRAYVVPGGSLSMGLTIGVAIGIIVFWSTTVGSLLPLFASLVGLDPALVSGPLMSTLVDATGLFIYLTVAKLVLGI